MLAVPTSAGDNDAWHHYSRDALTDGTETLCFSPQKEDRRTNLAETSATMFSLDFVKKMCFLDFISLYNYYPVEFWILTGQKV